MNYRLFWFFLKPYKILYGSLLIVMAVSSVLDALSLAAFFPLLSSMVGTSGGDLDPLRRFVMSMAARFPFSDPILAAAAILLVVFAAKAITGFIREALVAYSSGRVFGDLKDRLFEGYLESPYAFFLDNKTGYLMYRGIRAPIQVANLMRRLPQMATEILKGAAVLLVLMLIFPLGVLVLAVLGLVYYQIVRYLARKVSYNMGRERARVQAEEEVIAQELLAGIRQIMMFSTNRHWLAKFSRMNRAFVNIYAKDMVWVALPKQVMEFSAVIVLLSILFVSRLRSQESLTSLLPELGIFAAGLVQLLPTITDLGRLRMEIAGLVPDAEGLQEALTERHIRVQEGSKPFPGLKETIHFEQVDFAHGSRALLLRNLNVTFKKNNVTALVGSSGSGKSTIVNLLVGLFEPGAGRIVVDGVPLAEYDLESWRGAIGVVTQDPFLFHGTIAENILFGRKGFSMDDVIEAAHVANAHDFIAQLPEGYETVVGDRGMKLSGGQQQRVSIARAILGRPQILIFDEATSALDAVSERIIQETMTMLSNQRTVIQIAHRASTIARADKIVVLHEGQIVEEGRHVDLLKNDGEYARLFTHSR